MKLVVAIVRPDRINEILEALYKADIRGITMTKAKGHGQEVEFVANYRGISAKMDFTDKIRLEIGVSDDFVDVAVKAIMDSAQTGDIGDGKIFVLPVESVYRIRTGEKDEQAVTPLDE